MKLVAPSSCVCTRGSGEDDDCGRDENGAHGTMTHRYGFFGPGRRPVKRRRRAARTELQNAKNDAPGVRCRNQLGATSTRLWRDQELTALCRFINQEAAWLNEKQYRSVYPMDLNKDLLGRVLQSPRLPSIPTVALKVIDLAQQPDVEFSDIAEAIQHDPGLSTKILKTVNSPFYGQAREISTVSRALQVLGLNSVKTLALGFSLVGNLQSSQGTDFDHVAYWRRSLYTATAARTLSRRAGIVQQEEAFIGGLLQDMGMVALSQSLGDEYAAVLEKAGGDHTSLRRHEVEVLGLDHAEVGGALAETWGLPPVLIAPIRHHEEPDNAAPELLTLVRSISLGNCIADIFLSTEGKGTALEAYYVQVKAWFEVPGDEAEPTLKEIHAPTQDLGISSSYPPAI